LKIIRKDPLAEKVSSSELRSSVQTGRCCQVERSDQRERPRALAEKNLADL
jgi:hypothetical protein